MHFLAFGAGLIAGVIAGVIFSGKISAAMKSLEMTIAARLLSLEQSIVSSVKPKL